MFFTPSFSLAIIAAGCNASPSANSTAILAVQAVSSMALYGFGSFFQTSMFTITSPAEDC